MTESEQITDEEVEKYLKLACFGPVISKDQLDDMEKVAQEAAVTRRVGLMLLTKDAKFIRKMRIEEPELFEETWEALKGYKDHMEAALEFATCIERRMEVTDMWIESGGKIDNPFDEEEQTL